MNLRALRMFVATAETGSLGQASTRLNVSQPAASRQIDALEAELGVSLFHRVGRRLQVTSAGERLLRQSLNLLTNADLLAEEARALKEGRRGTLRVSATAQLIAAFLTSFLPHYRRRASDIEVELIERGGVNKQRTRLQRAEIDLAIMPATDASFAGRLLFPIHTIAVMTRSHPLARRAVLDITDIANEPLMLLQGEFGSRASFDAGCEIAQVIPRVRFECSSVHTLVGLAGVEHGVAIVSSITMIEHDERLRAVPLVLRGESIGHWEAICWDARRSAPPFVEVFVNELVAYARRGFPNQKLLRRAPSIPKPASPFR
jgi:DNA-binding transcriptional LysR family regulator